MISTFISFLILNPAIPVSSDFLSVDIYQQLFQQIVCIDPVQKKIIRKLDMPAKNMTSLSFGGEDFSTLYATSATLRMSQEELASAPDSGRAFEIKGLGVKGLPPAEAIVDSSLIAKVDN